MDYEASTLTTTWHTLRTPCHATPFLEHGTRVGSVREETGDEEGKEFLMQGRHTVAMAKAARNCPPGRLKDLHCASRRMQSTEVTQ